VTNIEKVQAVLHETGGQIEYKYPTGQVSTVTLAMAGLGTKRIRVANLPPEISEEELRASLTPYGKIIDMGTERWSKHYRYAVENWVRQVSIMMDRHVPSHLTVAGCRVLLSYERQPAGRTHVPRLPCTSEVESSQNYPDTTNICKCISSNRMERISPNNSDNQMFLQKHILPRQKQGILICLPKSHDSHTPDDYHPISLLNTEYKLLAWVLACRLRQILADQLSTSQYCAYQATQSLTSWQAFMTY